MSISDRRVKILTEVVEEKTLGVGLTTRGSQEEIERDGARTTASVGGEMTGEYLYAY